MRIATILISIIALLVLGFPEYATKIIGEQTAWMLGNGGSLVLWLASACLLICLLLVVGPWGRLRLGKDSERPEFSTFSWLAMLFAAGMGSGLVFWGVAEPLTHAVRPPIAGLHDFERYRTALAVTYFHWCLHAWAVYAVAGLVVAWFSYRHGAAESPSGALQAGLKGWLPLSWRQGLGTASNALAVAAVVFGVAGALANGTLLLHAGLERATSGGLPGRGGNILILLLLGLVALLSARSGIKRGIRWLSHGNVILALFLMFLVILNSQWEVSLKLLWGGVTRYLEILPVWSFKQARVDSSLDWSAGWTVTYFLWWIAWTPFVGVFIARISRGRSLRGFVLGVVGVPVLFSMLWFAVLGGGALAYDTSHEGVLSLAVVQDYTQPLFQWFQAMPGPTGTVLTWVACVLLFVFLVTSADSAAYVLGMISRGGDPDPPVRGKLLWGGLTVLLAAGLMFRNSADVNKAVAIAGAIPYSVVLVLQVIAWMRCFVSTVRGNNASAADEPE